MADKENNETTTPPVEETSVVDPAVTETVEGSTVAEAAVNPTPEAETPAETTSEPPAEGTTSEAETTSDVAADSKVSKKAGAKSPATKPATKTTAKSAAKSGTAPEPAAVKTAETSSAPEETKPHYQQFFDQYLTMLRAGRSDQAIKALNNALKSMLQDGTQAAFTKIFELYKENVGVLTVNSALQSVATVSSNDRAVIEIITTIFCVLSNNNAARINLDVARGIIKNEAFINWCARRLK